MRRKRGRGARRTGRGPFPGRPSSYPSRKTDKSRSWAGPTCRWPHIGQGSQQLTQWQDGTRATCPQVRWESQAPATGAAARGTQQRGRPEPTQRGSRNHEKNKAAQRRSRANEGVRIQTPKDRQHHHFSLLLFAGTGQWGRKISRPGTP